MSADETLRATLERCTERMRRVWSDDAAIPKEPEYEFRIVFTATESVGLHLMQLVASSPTRDRRYNYRRVGGGDGDA